jgi:hypothetical protein|tara:strand:- start:28 stop:444 length:417 start_codon:yes stop_codon:yes gene_type:complete
MAAIGLKIGKAVFNILSGDSTITTLIGTAANIQPSAIYTQAPRAGIYYDVLSVDNEYTKTSDKPGLTIVTLQIESFMNKYADAISLAVRVQELFDKIAEGTYNTIKIQSCILDSQTTDFDGDNKYYYVESTYRLRIID